jgi:predicted DNA-binding transcriptional regulator YafY
LSKKKSIEDDFMRRADRLFRIVELLKARRQVVTAEYIAQVLEVSKRTIYRDIADLSASGVPIIGEAGAGYTLDKAYVVRPLIFDIEELDALMLGAQMVQNWGDSAIAKAAMSAINKIGSVLPDTLREDMMTTALFSPTGHKQQIITINFTALRRAVRTKHIITFDYTKPDGEKSQRRVRPLCLAFFGPEWLLMGWCEIRHDFRNFRLDRMSELVILETQFDDEDGKRLNDFEAQIQGDYQSFIEFR